MIFLVIQERCTRTIAIAYIGSVLLCIPSFITFGIEQQQVIIGGVDLNGLASNYTVFLPTMSPALAVSSPAPSVEGAAASIAVIYKVNLNPIAKTHDGIVHKVR